MINNCSKTESEDTGCNSDLKTVSGQIHDAETSFLDDMKASGLTEEMLENNGVTVFNDSPDKLSKMLNIEHDFASHLVAHHTIILFPNPSRNGKGSESFRAKLIPPFTCEDGKQIKYMQPRGVTTRPYIIDSVWHARKDPAIDLFIVEGEKKALLLNQEGFPAIALPGVYNFRNTSEENADTIDLTADLRAFVWSERKVYIAFDADYRTNKQVRQAMFELAFRLEKHGAIVKIVTWNAKNGKGIDDYIVGLANEQEVKN